MSDNVFEMLARKSSKTDKGDQSKESTASSKLEDALKLSTNDVVSTEGEDSAWTVQSTKTRRLVPQFSLSRQDLGSDSSRSKPSTMPEIPKKKVIRFTKDEMLALRKPSKILSVMSDMLEVVSLTSLEPVCFDKLEPEDVVRIWNSDNQRNHKDNAGGRGRGRGPNVNSGNNGSANNGNRNRPSDDSAHSSNQPAAEWTQRSTNRSGGGLWDDGSSGSAAGGLDLADFAAAALKFRSEMAEMKLADGEEDGSAGEDMMERLLREQNAEDDEDAMPDWAADDDVGLDLLGQSASQQSLGKKSLLLETLNVSAAVSVVGGVAASQPQVSSTKSALLTSVLGGAKPQPQQQPLLADTSSIDHLLMPSFAPPLPVVVEWFYTDPQNQVQGPFSQDNMQLWHDAGYFSKDLPIKLRSWGGFYPFITVFPDLKNAFLSAPAEPRSSFPPGSLMTSVIAEQQKVNQLREQELRQQQAAEAQRQAVEAQRKQAAEEQRKAAEAKRQVEVAQQRQAGPPPLVPATAAGKSETVPLDALKKIRISTNIGELNRSSESSSTGAAKKDSVSSTAKNKAASVGPPPLPQEKQNDSGSTWANNAVPNSASKSSKESLLSIQKAERERVAQEKMVHDQEAKLQQKAAKNWISSNGAGAAKNLSASLADIQEEETRRQQKQKALTTSQQPPAAPLTMSSQLKSLLGVKTAGGVASPTPAAKQWGGAAPPTSSESTAGSLSLRDIMQQEEKQSTPSSERAPTNSRRQQPLSWAAKTGTGVNATNLLPPPSAQQQVKPIVAQEPAVPSTVIVKNTKPAGSPAKKESSSDFGGKRMSRDMAEWCIARLKKINGSEDLTLLEFCLTLDSASEIREYLAQYLGSSPQLTNFATDFINYKDGNKGVAAVSVSAPGGAAFSSGSNSAVNRKKKAAGAGK